MPRDKGGKDSFENLVWAKKEINSLKANRLPHEVGLRPRRTPRAESAAGFGDEPLTQRRRTWNRGK